MNACFIRPCRFCANFTLTQLQPLFKNKLINHVQLDIIPFGNARTDPSTGEEAAPMILVKS
jgi:hypothetical protein